MNTKLIEQMAEEAANKDCTVVDYADPGAPFNQTTYCFYQEEMERFAEAIVRRCADFAWEEGASGSPKHRILAEFGIEK